MAQGQPATHTNYIQYPQNTSVRLFVADRRVATANNFLWT